MDQRRPAKTGLRTQDIDCRLRHLFVLGRHHSAHTDRADQLAICHDGKAALKRGDSFNREEHLTSADNHVLNSFRGTLEMYGSFGLSNRDIHAAKLCVVQLLKQNQTGAGIHNCDCDIPVILSRFRFSRGHRSFSIFEGDVFCRAVHPVLLFLPSGPPAGPPSVLLLDRPPAGPPTELQFKSSIWYSDCMALEIGQIRHVGLFTATVKQHARFYSEVWGLDQFSETADAVYFRGSSPEPFIFSLHQNNTRGLHHIAYAMADENAVRRAASVLRESGVRIVEDPHVLQEPGGG